MISAAYVHVVCDLCMLLVVGSEGRNFSITRNLIMASSDPSRLISLLVLLLLDNPQNG